MASVSDKLYCVQEILKRKRMYVTAWLALQFALPPARSQATPASGMPQSPCQAFALRWILPMIVLVALAFHSAPPALQQSVRTLPVPSHGAGDISTCAQILYLHAASVPDTPVQFMSACTSTIYDMCGAEFLSHAGRMAPKWSAQPRMNKKRA